MSVQLSAPDEDTLARVRRRRGDDGDVEGIARSCTLIAAAVDELQTVEDELAGYWTKQLEGVLRSMMDTPPPNLLEVDKD